MHRVFVKNYGDRILCSGKVTTWLFFLRAFAEEYYSVMRFPNLLSLSFRIGGSLLPVTRHSVPRSAAAKPHRNLIRAALCSSVAHLVRESGAALLPSAISIVARIGYCRDAHVITINVDASRRSPAP
jgi:hypothetical protein